MSRQRQKDKGKTWNVRIAVTSMTARMVQVDFVRKNANRLLSGLKNILANAGFVEKRLKTGDL